MSKDRQPRKAAHEAAPGTTNRDSDLRDAAGAFGRIFDASSDAMGIVDLNGRVVRWNRAAQELHGWREDEVLGEILPHVSADMHMRGIQDLRAVAASGRTATSETVLLGKDGSGVPVTLTVIPYMDADGDPVGVVIISRRLGGDIEPAEYPDDFSLAFSRALSPPLTALVGYAQLLLQADIAEDVSRRTRTVRAIEEHAALLSELLDDVVLVSDARLGAAAAQLEDVEIASVVTDAVRRVERSRVGRRFTVDFEPSLGPVRAARSRLEGALAGLIGIVADRVAAGSISVTVTKEGDYAVIGIESGPVQSKTSGSSSAPRDDDSLPWHVARLTALAYGGRVERVDAVRDSVAYRMMVPVTARASQD